MPHFHLNWNLKSFLVHARIDSFGICSAPRVAWILICLHRISRIYIFLSISEISLYAWVRAAKNLLERHTTPQLKHPPLSWKNPYLFVLNNSIVFFFHSGVVRTYSSVLQNILLHMHVHTYVCDRGDINSKFHFNVTFI